MTPSPCGTNSAYRRHLRLNQQPCDPCRAAHSQVNTAGAVRRRAARLDTEPCGTPRGHRRHLVRDEAPCDPCSAANKAAYRDRIDRTEAERRAIPSPYLSVENTSASFGDRVFSYVEVDHPSGCWWWTGTTDDNGYGVIGRGGRGTGTMPAHQAVWQLLVGPVPDGLTFDHLCLNHPCVNPDHGEIVTRAENARRSGRCRFYRSRTTCNFGHPFDGTTKNGRLTVRYCKTCARDRMRARSRTTLNEGIAA